LQEQTAKAAFCIGSVDDYQFIVRQVVPDRMDERDGSAITNGRSIDAAPLELVDEGMVVVGTHGGPSVGESIRR